MVVTDGRGNRPRRHPEPPHEARGDVAVLPVPLHHRDPRQVARHVRPLVAIGNGDLLAQMLGDDLSFKDSNHIRLFPVARRAEILGLHPRRIDRATPHRRDLLPRREGRVIRHHAPAQHQPRIASLQRAQRHDIRPIPRRHQPPVL